MQEKNCVIFLVLLTFFFFWCIIWAMEKYEHVRNFDVGFCDVDFKEEVKPSVFLRYFEEAASTSAEELGFGHSFCKENGCAFFLTEIHIEFLRPVKLQEKIQVKTWPLAPSFVVFNREYQICTQEEELLVSATSRWGLVNREDGKILPSKTVSGQDYSTYRTDKALEINGKIRRFDYTEGRLAFSLTIANSEYDHNMHVNNTRYADYCFNCFTVAQLQEKKVKNFSLSYVKQCHEGETIRFYRKDEGNATLICGVNEQDETVVRSEIIFEE